MWAAFGIYERIFPLIKNGSSYNGIELICLHLPNLPKIVQSLLAFVIICLSTFLKRTYMYLMNTIKFHKKILFWKTRLKIF